jgi:hypothetical protein
VAERAALPLPIALEAIDRDWLTAALRQHAPEAAVRGFSIVDVNHGTCTKVRLQLDLDEAGRRAGIPERVILKGGFEPHSRDMDFMHATEVTGYQFVFPELKLPSPACYFAQFDADQRQGIVIMDDLAARGVEFCHALKPQSFEAVARRLTILAEFHARTWDSAERLAAGPWGRLGEYMARTRDYAEAWLQPDTWRRFIDSPRGAAASVRFHDLGWMREALARLAVWAEDRPHAVLHGDTHLGNLYVDRDGTPSFFDPTVHRGPAIAEVSYHMACALDPADRPRWEGALVGHYLDELRRCGVEPPDFNQAMADYGATLARAYFIFVINESAFQPEAINTAYVARISAAMIDHDTIGLLERMG